MWRRSSKQDPEAARAVKAAQKNLEAVKSRECEVKEVVQASETFRKKNHFAEQLSTLFAAPPPHLGKDNR